MNRKKSVAIPLEVHDSHDVTTLTNGPLTLRSPEAGDAPAVAEAARTSFADLDPWMPWASVDYGIDDAMFWINNRHETGFIIIDAHGTHVGTCGLNGFDEMNKRANLGYWVRSSHAGLGIATAATRMVARHGLTELGLQRLEVIMSVKNEASRRVAERAGAAHEGVLRNRLWLKGEAHDAHSFSITAIDQLKEPSA